MFEDVLDKYKDDLIESLVACGEACRVHKILSYIEMNRDDYLYFYEEGVKIGATNTQESVNNAQEKLVKVLAVVQKYLEDLPIYAPMSQFELGVLEVASEIEEMLKWINFSNQKPPSNSSDNFSS